MKETKPEPQVGDEVTIRDDPYTGVWIVRNVFSSTCGRKAAIARCGFVRVYFLDEIETTFKTQAAEKRQ